MMLSGSRMVCKTTTATAAPAPMLRGATRPVAAVRVTAGLRKETKKLTKVIRQHRQRLESLVAVVAAQDAAAAVAPASSSSPLSPAQLHAVLVEIAQLQTSLVAVRRQQQQLAAMQQQEQQLQVVPSLARCSSSSTDDSDCEPSSSRAACDQQQQQERCSSPRQPVVAALCVMEPPAIDQDICAQLPPPQQHRTPGRVLVCQGKACMRAGALQVLQAASHATSASDGVDVLPCKCLGKCKQAPAMRVRAEEQEQLPASAVFTQVAPLEVPEILDQLLC